MAEIKRNNQCLGNDKIYGQGLTIIGFPEWEIIEYSARMMIVISKADIRFEFRRWKQYRSAKRKKVKSLPLRYNSKYL